MFFKRKVLIKSSFDTKTVKSKINNLTIRRHQINTERKHYQFEGTIDEKYFLLLPIFDYHTNYLFRPKICGEIDILKDGSSLIILNFKLPVELYILLWSALAINVFFAMSLLEERYLCGYIIFGLIFWGILLGVFHYKVSKSVDIIAKSVRGKKQGNRQKSEKKIKWK
jgi:hypothetical protein